VRCRRDARPEAAVMPRHVWRLALLVQLALAAVAALAATRAWPGSALAPAVAFVAVLLGFDAALVAVSYLMGRVLGGRAAAVPCGLALRAAAGEVAAYATAKLGMALDRAAPDGTAPDRTAFADMARGGRTRGPAAGSRPVLLVHGIYCNRGVWSALRRALRAAGFGPVRALTLEPLLAGIDAYVPRVAREVAALRGSSPDGRVAIVAHSMGGLVARAYLREAGDAAARAIRTLVTLGTPHHGSHLAALGTGPAARQMRPGSEWLAALNGAQENAWPVPVTSVYSRADNLVVPASSAALGGTARVLETAPVGHFRLVRSPRVAREVIAALEAAGA